MPEPVRPPEAVIGPDRSGLGIALILGSVLLMAFADAVVKLLSAELALWQLFVARSLVALPIVTGLMLASGTGVRLRAPGWSLARSALLVLTWLAFYASLPVLDLSIAAVAVYTNPIMIALLSAAIARERVTRRQWAGVLLGFAGVVAILRPGSEAFAWATALPLVAAACYAGAMVITRSRCQHESPLALALWLHVSFIATGVLASATVQVLDLSDASVARAPFLLAGWAPMGLREWGLMALLGALSVAYFAGVARAYQVAAPSVVATFDYAYLIFASVWGWVFFSEMPDTTKVLGMLLITAAGLLVAMRRDLRPRASPRGSSMLISSSPQAPVEHVAPAPAPPSAAWEGTELLAAVRGALRDELAPLLTEPRARAACAQATHALGILERMGAQPGPAGALAEPGAVSLLDGLYGAGVVAASGHDGASRAEALELRLTKDIRDGTLDGACGGAVREILYLRTRARLAVTNPDYLANARAPARTPARTPD